MASCIEMKILIEYKFKIPLWTAIKCRIAGAEFSRSVGEEVIKKLDAHLQQAIEKEAKK